MCLALCTQQKQKETRTLNKGYGYESWREGIGTTGAHMDYRNDIDASGFCWRFQTTWYSHPGHAHCAKYSYCISSSSFDSRSVSPSAFRLMNSSSELLLVSLPPSLGFSSLDCRLNDAMIMPLVTNQLRGLVAHITASIKSVQSGPRKRYLMSCLRYRVQTGPYRTCSNLMNFLLLGPRSRIHSST